MLDLSIIIVNYKTPQLLLACLKSIYSLSQGNLTFETIVVDNNSGDDSVDLVRTQYPQVHVIANPENVGFARANNAGLEIARGRYLLLLNSDTEVEAFSLEEMVKLMDNKKTVGIAGCRLVKGDGKLDLACRRGFPTPSVSFYRLSGLSRVFPKSRRFGRYNLTYLDEKGEYEVDAVVGAFMLIRREVYEAIGGLDGTFFMYGEDIDYCYRAKEAGWQVYYKGDVLIHHYKGQSSKKRPEIMIHHFYHAMEIFYTKHYSKKYSALVNWLVWGGITLAEQKALFLNKLRKEKYVSK